MKLIEYKQFPDEISASAVTIGNFDGVHVGHQTVINQLKQAATARNLPTVVVIFEPHPRVYFDPHCSMKRITSLEEKLKCFEKLGVDYVVCLKFDASMAQLTPEAFIETILVKHLKAKYLVVGDDFHFGKNRAGNINTLEHYSQQWHYDVTHMHSIMHDNHRISSRDIRRLLTEANVEIANKFLGYHYRMSGIVVKGAQLGRKLGYPTANIPVEPELLLLPYGIYTVAAKIDQRNNAHSYPAIASLGIRPTVTHDKTCVLEVHFFDFDQDIYGEHLTIEFIQWLRDEEKFSSLDELKMQMALDVQRAKAYFNVEQAHD